MGRNLLRKALCGLLVAVSALTFAQTPDELEDITFAASVFELKMQRLREGDLADRSSEFPKSELGVFMGGIYKVARNGMVRDLYLERKLAEFHFEKIASGIWFDSPVAALRQLTKIVSLYGAAKKSYILDMKGMETLLGPKSDDTTILRDFKAGVRKGFADSQKMIGTRDIYTLTLIYLARHEEAYRFLEQNPKDRITGPGAVFFLDEKTNDIWQQKLDAVDKAEAALLSYNTLREKRVKQVKQQFGGG